MKTKGNGITALKKTILFLSLVGAAGILEASGEEAIEISTDAKQLLLVSTAAGPARMKLVVTGPNGFREEQYVEGDGIFWTAPVGAENGMYRFDVYSTPVDELAPPAGLSDMGESLDGRAAPTNSRSSGSFRIDNGVIVTPRGEDDLSSTPLRSFNRMVGTIAGLMVDEAHAADLTASSNIPTVNLEDTNLTANNNVWDIKARETGCAGAQSSAIELVDEVNENVVMSLCGEGNSTTVVPNANSIVVDQAGDVRFADSALFVDRSTGNVGIGNTSPGQELVIIESTFPFIDIEETSGTSNAGIGLTNPLTGSGDKLFLLRPSGNIEFKNNGGPIALTWEHGSNFIGIGTDDPTYLLDVEVDGGGIDGVPFSAVNTDGKVRFLLTASGQSWTFDNTPNGDGGFFSVSKVGTGVNEFRVEADGDGYFRGRSFATQHVNLSSRASKTDFVPVAVMSVLDKLAELPVTRWRYQSDADNDVHIGPVAEDFRDLFGLGDGKTISTVDASGVAFAALQGLHQKVQGLNQQVQARDAEIAAMKAANEAMAERLARLEAMVLDRTAR